MEEYSKAYLALKPTRQLVWKHHLGTVEIELEFPGKTLQFSLSPLQATIIMHFQEKGNSRKLKTLIFYQILGH